MISDTRQSQLSFSLLPFGKKVEDFFCGVPSFMRGRNGLDHIDAHNDTAAIEPIADVFGIRNPLKIANMAISSDFVLMVDDGKTKWIGDKSFSDQTMDGKSFDFSIKRKLDLWIAISAMPDRHGDTTRPSLGWSRLISVRVDKAIKASDVTKTANLVTYISGDVSPLFSGFRVNKLRTIFGEKPSYNSLNVELLGLSFSRLAQIRNGVTVIYGRREQSRRQGPRMPTAHAMIGNPAKPSNSKLIRNFILSFISWDGKPSLGETVVHCLSPVLSMLSKAQKVYRHSNVVGQYHKLSNENKESKVCR